MKLYAVPDAATPAIHGTVQARGLLIGAAVLYAGFIVTLAASGGRSIDETLHRRRSAAGELLACVVIAVVILESLPASVVTAARDRLDAVARQAVEFAAA